MNLRRRTIAAIPNLFTLSSVVCGFWSITWSTRGGGEADLFKAALCICLAFFFDTFDGRLARLTKSQSALGLQLDSLADVVSFGVAPAMLVYKWGLFHLGPFAILGCGAFVAAAAYRLARFNVLTADDEMPKKYIVGLPVPVAAAVIVSLVLALRQLPPLGRTREVAILALVVTLSFFMVSRIPFRSFKGTRINRQSIAVLTLVLTGSVAVAARLSWTYVLLFLVSAYLTLGVAESLLLATTKRIQARRMRRLAARGGAVYVTESVDVDADVDADVDGDDDADDDAALDALALAPVSVNDPAERE